MVVDVGQRNAIGKRSEQWSDVARGPHGRHRVVVPGPIDEIEAAGLGVENSSRSPNTQEGKADDSHGLLQLRYSV